ncbi:MAG: cell division protein FtsB [Pseudomonadota bacterium]
MRAMTFIALALIAGLQYKLWFGQGSVQEVWQLRDQIDDKRQETQQLVERNRALFAEVNDLKSGLDAVEEIARTELGMIREDEVFFQLLDDTAAARE